MKQQRSIPVKPKLLVAAIAQALALQTANAATVEVTSNLDNGFKCTLREAVASINAGFASIRSGCYNLGGSFGNNDQIIFAPDVSGSTITLNGSEINIKKSVSINPGGSDTTISGNNASRIFLSITSGTTLELDHLILTKGYNSFGGAAIDTFGTTLVITNSTISGNTGGIGAGILAQQNSRVSLTDSVVSNNSAQRGGGIYAKTGSNLTLTNSTISTNLADDSGGGIFVSSDPLSSDSTVILSNSKLLDNIAASRDGGGLRAYYHASIVLTNSTVSGNSAYRTGGGMYAGASYITVDSTNISGNTADAGGGLRLNASSVSLTNSTIAGNTAMGSGGGLRAFISSINLAESTISNNSASFDGGGLDVGQLTIVMTDSTVSGNTAGRAGAGLYASTSTVNLSNSTVSDNSVGYIGGGLFVRLSSATVTNSVVANSIGGYDCRASGGSTLSVDVNSIIENDACGTTTQHIDPGLMPLADNGGPTETHALIPGSPAIDGGNNATCETTDQRGEARDDGACDIGAYEFKTTVMPIAKKDRKMNSLMSGGEQWYSFNSTESQKLSMQTNGSGGDTVLEFYKDNKNITNQLSMDDDSGPELFSNIKQTINSGPHYIRVKGKTDVDPYFLRLMSDKDILSFNDTASHFANQEIRVMSSAGITGGCGTGIYCPNNPVTRAQMAIFMLKAISGGNHSSPAATGSVFSDVGISSFGSNFIEEFSTLGITSGCGGGKYCPDTPVTREQMAVFLLRAWYGSSYTPPAATPAEINQFSDISSSFAKDWIVQLTKENITGGCGGGKFCPTDTVTRGQMAAFITRTFSLDTEL